MGYKRASTRPTKCNIFRGFRLNNVRKISIHKLRVKFMHLFKVLYKWRRSYKSVIKSIRKKICCKTNFIEMNSCRLRSLGRTNSFYTEAISDCLEFIKRNSVSLRDLRAENIVTQIIM
ncbi:hypothetical protein RND81_11G226800 [Saponaria officinalis]|uniref:Ribosomal protein L20 n=1 Tax=Saponaria officinalis TaxID=3572 RepID=A0AAW1HQX6_SAPOF